MTAQNAEYDEFATFGEASDAMLRMMRSLLDLDLWLVARVHDEDWVVLYALGEGPIVEGSVLPLKSTICNEMLAGNGPHVAPDISEVPAYSGVPILEHFDVSSYAGAPLMVNGAIYGVLCGMSASSQSDRLTDETPHLITAARTLSTILGQQLHSEALVRRAERAEMTATVDEMTNLYNRRGWEKLVALEQARGRRYGHKHAVFFMDIDGLKAINDERGHAAGDMVIKRAADAIREVIREHDVAARLGGDEFALLATETAGAEAEVIRERLAERFRAAGVSMSIGFARTGVRDLAAATREADEHMYRRKSERGDRRAAS